MNRKNHTTEDLDRRSVWNQDTYQTGSTQPPKSRGGLIAFLLGLVIFLCGISTALGLMNIRLFRALNDRGADTVSPVAFSRTAGDAAPESAPDYFPLGFSGQAVPEFWIQYAALPQGIYITEVCDRAAAKGIVPGDILMGVDGMPVTDAAGLRLLLSSYQAGDSVEAVLYRDGSSFSCNLAVDP